jgi:hypothetical protein
MRYAAIAVGSSDRVLGKLRNSLKLMCSNVQEKASSGGTVFIVDADPGEIGRVAAVNRDPSISEWVQEDGSAVQAVPLGSFHAQMGAPAIPPKGVQQGAAPGASRPAAPPRTSQVIDVEYAPSVQTSPQHAAAAAQARASAGPMAGKPVVPPNVSRGPNGAPILESASVPTSASALVATSAVTTTAGPPVTRYGITTAGLPAGTSPDPEYHRALMRKALSKLRRRRGSDVRHEGVRCGHLRYRITWGATQADITRRCWRVDVADVHGAHWILAEVKGDRKGAYQPALDILEADALVRMGLPEAPAPGERVARPAFADLANAPEGIEAPVPEDHDDATDDGVDTEVDTEVEVAEPQLPAPGPDAPVVQSAPRLAGPEQDVLPFDDVVLVQDSMFG